MNIDKHIFEELKSVIVTDLPEFNLLRILDESGWDKISSFPYLYLYVPAETAEEESYENSNSYQTNVLFALSVFVGFKSKNDISKQGYALDEYWDKSNKVKECLSGIIIDTYRGRYDLTEFNPIVYRGKEIINPNNGNGVGLGIVHFQIKATVKGSAYL